MEVTINEYELIFSAEPIAILDLYKQRKSNAPESGGIVLGKILENKIHILKLSVPTELDKASRMNFERHRLSAQIIINYEFFNSNGQITYLGEWHTHPEKYPSPSITDMRMIQKQFLENKIHTDFLLLLIQGLNELYIAVFDKTGLSYMSYKNEI